MPVEHSVPMATLCEAADLIVGEKIRAEYNRAIAAGMNDPVVEVRASFVGPKVRFDLRARFREAVICDLMSGDAHKSPDALSAVCRLTGEQTPGVLPVILMAGDRIFVYPDSDFASKS